MDFSENEITEILTDTFSSLHNKYKWHGEIIVDCKLNPNGGKFNWEINLNMFTFFVHLRDYYKSHGYEEDVLINYIHALVSHHIRYNFIDFFDKHIILHYHYLGYNYLKEIDKKSTIYKLKLT